MPIVISTSSITLQKAICRDYLPQISRTLMENGIIKKPLSCVLRKGKEHYICDKNLHNHYLHSDGEKKRLLKPLLFSSLIDLGEATELSAHDKQKICVSGRCEENCPQYNECRYMRHMKRVQSAKIDFQVCNHNYFLADVIRRSKGQTPLIPNYQAVIIDEGHKFLQAAQSMYGIELSSVELSAITNDIGEFTHKTGGKNLEAHKLSSLLDIQNNELFKLLNKRVTHTDYDDETERYKTVIDNAILRCLNKMQRYISALEKSLDKNLLSPHYHRRCAQICSELPVIKEKVALLERHANIVYWLDKSINRGGFTTEESVLCAIPKNLGDMLYSDLWSKKIPIILTSGTLSANECFEHIKRKTGLCNLPNILEAKKPSPFNYNENKLIYISESMPFPNNKDKRYIQSVVDEVKRLVIASYGHAAVLFTSYNVMGLVFTELGKHNLPFPMFRLDKGDTAAIDCFKQSGNGILFASGALWEGIDIPGDTLSLLIIVKLPFPVPDPISEYEQTLYKSFSEYKNAVIEPEMLIKLKQGDGRLIRAETDTGVVAIIDIRAGLRGAYRKCVINALPNCAVTSNVNDISKFLQAKKPPDYYR